MLSGRSNSGIVALSVWYPSRGEPKTKKQNSQRGFRRRLSW